MEREENKGEGESGGLTLQSHFAFHLAGETGVEWNDAAAQRWLRSPGRVLLHEAAYIAPLPAGGGANLQLFLARKGENGD
jgi:hypothetical protein